MRDQRSIGRTGTPRTACARTNQPAWEIRRGLLSVAYYAPTKDRLAHVGSVAPRQRPCWHFLKPKMVGSACFWACAIVFIISGLFASESLAHKVKVFAYAEGDRLTVQGYFGGKTKAANCAVCIYDSKGVKIGEGVTDSEGLWEFPLPESAPVSGNLLVVLEAGSGHRAEYVVESGDLPARKSQSGATTQQPASPARAAQSAPNDIPQGNEEQYARLVDETLAKRIGPLVKMLSNQQKILMEMRDKGPGVSEIIGGIGWIFGLVGVGAYFARRNGRKEP